MEESHPMDSRRLERMLCMLLLAMTLAVFQNVAGFEFVNFDDIQYITENPHVRAGLTWEGVRWAFTTGHAGNWHPLTWLSHMLDSQLFGLNAGLHHLMNLLLHMTNTLLLFLLLKRITGALWRSALVAALFAVHPFHVESVAWISERKDVLSTLFCILSFWAYARYARGPGAGRYALVALLLSLGLMCKPMLVTLPFIFLLLDFWPLRRFHRNQISGGETRRFQSQAALHLIAEKIPFFVLSALSSVVTFFVQKKAGLVVSSDIYPLDIRLANALVSYVKYIGRMIWPDRLAVYYVHPDAIPLWESLAAGICLLGLTVFFLSRARRHAYLAVGWLWYLGTLVPVIGLVHVGGQAMADRYTYTSMIGLFILIAWGIPGILGKRKKWGTPFAVMAVVLLSACGLRAWMQVGFWKNSLSLWEHTLQVTDRNYVANNMLGGALAREGRLQEALVHFTEAIRIKPDYEKAHYNLSLALVEEKKYEEAMDHLARVLELGCDFPEAVYDKQGEILMHQGREREAQTKFETALQMDPWYFPARLNIGNCLERSGRIEEAMLHYSKALEINPYSALPHFHIGKILLAHGRIREAVIHYTKAIQSNPELPEAYYNLGVVMDHQGKTREAMELFSKALALNAGYMDARNNLAVDLARQGRYREAMIHFSVVLLKEHDNEAARRNLDQCLRIMGEKE